MISVRLRGAYCLLLLLALLSGCGRHTSTSLPQASPGREGAIYGQAAGTYKARIVVDAGHGGDDEGTRSVDQPRLYEKQLTLSTTRMLHQCLEGMGYQVVLTRESDFFVPLKTRANYANDIKGDLFVSVHYNSAPNAQAQGIEVYFYDTGNEVERRNASRLFAKSVLDQVLRRTGAQGRGVRHGNFAVIRETKMPAVLVEAGFMSNATEMAKLRDPGYQERIAIGIAQGVDRYWSQQRR